MRVTGLQAMRWVHSASGSVWLDGTSGIVWVRRFCWFEVCLALCFESVFEKI